MTVTAAESQLMELLRDPATEETLWPGPEPAVLVLDLISRTGRERRWFVPVPWLLEVTNARGAGAQAYDRGAVGVEQSPSDREPPGGQEDPWVGSSRGREDASRGEDQAREKGPGVLLREALAGVGLGSEAVELFAVAAQTAGAVAGAAGLADVDGGPSDRAHASPTAPDGAGTDVPDLAERICDASHVLGLIGSLTRLTAHLEGTMVGVTGELTARNGRILLARKGVSDPSELTSDQARRWRARAKSVTRREIEALTGWGAGEVSDLVALATCPASVREPVVCSMTSGTTPWRLARRFLRELGHEAHEDTAEVAESLFGSDPRSACADRLDPDGTIKDGPWEHKLFHRALEAESTKLASRDPRAAVRARERARQKRDVRVVVNDDGTGTVSVSGTATQVAAAADRLERAARAARALGDPRTLADLRADIAMSLLLHSGLALPDPLPADTDTDGDSNADDQVRTAWTEQMRTVLAALPPAVLNVIVPFDALVHSPQRPLFGPLSTPPPASDPPLEVLSMGMVTGAFPQFLTPDAVRELALAPGTTLHRLLMDPADGRCVERSVVAYTPDAAMRAQVHAADVTCRAPGCVQHAPYTQLDHVVPYGDGGATSETNLQDLHSRHHQDKTHGGWEAVMAANRDVTWTSLLGRIYRTRCHDYRQYSTLLTTAVTRVHEEVESILAADEEARSRARAEGRCGRGVNGRGEAREDAPVTRRSALSDAVDRAVYRALTYRGPAAATRAGDDWPETETHPAFLGWDVISLTHTTAEGRRRHGPEPTAAAEEGVAQRATSPAEEPDAQRDAHTDLTDDVGHGGGERRRAAGGRRTGGRTTGWRHDVDRTPPPF